MCAACLLISGYISSDAFDGESILGAPSEAHARLSDGDDEAYWDASDARNEALGPQQPLPREWDGRFGVPGDRALIPVRMPRLAAMFPIPSPPNA